jgi:hypothetical protein
LKELVSSLSSFSPFVNGSSKVQLISLLKCYIGKIMKNYYPAFTSDVQNGQRLALIGIAYRQYGHSLVDGAAGAASG